MLYNKLKYFTFKYLFDINVQKSSFPIYKQPSHLGEISLVSFAFLISNLLLNL